MVIELSPARLSGAVCAPSSKSYVHRLLIAAYLSGEEVKVGCNNMSADVLATARVLRSFGAETQVGDKSITIKRGIIPRGRVTADCGESGSTLRFLLPLAAALGIKADFTGAARLLERPMTPLTEVLNRHGADIRGLSVFGKLGAGVYEVDASLSSQYVTGLLFALAALGEKSGISVKGERVSAGYIDITTDVLKTFGADVAVTEGGYEVNRGVQKGVREAQAEGDWSNAAFALAAGAIGGDVKVCGLNPGSVQGDRRIAEVLGMFGAKVSFCSGAVHAEQNRLAAVDVDIRDIPDLAQIISVVAAFARGVSVLRNVDRLRIKESDRVEAIINTLGAAGIRAEYSDNNLYIHGGAPKGGKFFSGNDHRTAMSAAILASFAEGCSSIAGAEAVNKSYPSFFADLKELGGVMNVVV